MTQPFDTFHQSISTATYDEHRAMPEAAVTSPAAFEEMRTYLLDLYDGVEAETSYVESDGQIIDCIPRERHPAARDHQSEVIPDPPPDVDRSSTPPPHFVSSSPSNEPTAVEPREYPPGTLPMYRTTLARLARFPNLAAFSAKTANPLPKHYATGEQDQNSLGGSSYVNVWRPFVTPIFQATFSQQWHLAGQDGTTLQTLECGWHIDPPRYGNNIDPHLFVYTTRQTYADGHSFFNQDGGVYRPLPNPLVLPGAALQFSQTDGQVIEYRMGFYLTAGAWYFYFNDQPVGYYPLDWFQGGPMSRVATRIKFGGEVGSGLADWPPMGSGAHAAAGYRKAAHQRAALVYPATGGAQDASLSEAGSTTGPCYSIGITNNSRSEWGTYAFFGGPGGLGC